MEFPYHEAATQINSTKTRTWATSWETQIWYKIRTVNKFYNQRNLIKKKKKTERLKLMKSSQMWPRRKHCKHLHSVYSPSNGVFVFVVLFWLFSTFLSRLHPNKGRSTAGTKRGMNTASNWLTHPKQSWQRAQLSSLKLWFPTHVNRKTIVIRLPEPPGRIKLVGSSLDELRILIIGWAAYSLTASGMLVL